jgi:hypothetical protein
MPFYIKNTRFKPINKPTKINNSDYKDLYFCHTGDEYQCVDSFDKYNDMNKKTVCQTFKLYNKFVTYQEVNESLIDKKTVSYFIPRVEPDNNSIIYNGHKIGLYQKNTDGSYTFMPNSNIVDNTCLQVNFFRNNRYILYELYKN